jgi:hypothetical protein
MAVATINPWAAGAVVFDQRPFLQFYEQQMARKQAKDDALDNYFRDLNKNVTSAGMRSQDVSSLLKKQQDAQQYYFQNKAQILNPKLDNGAAYSEYQARHQDMLGLIDQSKEAAKSMDEIGKMKLNPQMSYIFEDPKFMDQLRSHELPIGDPNRKGITLASLTVPDKPVDIKEWDAYNKYLTGGIPHDKIPGETKSIGNFKTSTPIYQQYSPENQKVIAEHAMNAYESDRRWRTEANKTFQDIMHDPMKYDQYNKMYKSIYGKDIDTPKEAWAAKGIIDNNMKAVEYKEGEDFVAKERFKDALSRASQEELIKFRKNIDPNDMELNNQWIDRYLQNRLQTAMSDEANYRKVYTPHTTKYGYEISMDPVLAKSFSRGGSEPDRLYVTDDGQKIWPIFYKYEKDPKTKQTILVKNDKGDPVIDEDISKPLEMDQAKLAMGYRGETKKQLGKTMSSKTKSTQPKYPLPAGKPATVKQNGYTYHWNSEIGSYE